VPSLLTATPVLSGGGVNNKVPSNPIDVALVRWHAIRDALFEMTRAITRRRFVAGALAGGAGLRNSLPSLTPAKTAAGTRIAITDVTVIDATGATPLPHMTVTIEGERIAGIQPGDAISNLDGMRVVDGTGRFLIPGLWDAHVHTFVFPRATGSPASALHRQRGDRHPGHGRGVADRRHRRHPRRDRLWGAGGTAHRGRGDGRRTDASLADRRAGQHGRRRATGGGH
jgi:hypothetical protein